MTIPTGWQNPGFWSGGGTGFPAGIGADLHSPQGQWIGPTGMQFGPNQEAMNNANIAQKDRVLAEQRRRFNLLYPQLLTDMKGTTGPGSSFASTLGPAPAFTASPIWGPDQVQQQVNAAHAGVDARAETRGRDAAAALGGRGFGGNSPLLAALQGRFQSQAAAQGADQERGIRWDAAQGNADYMLKGQQAQESAYEARAREEIQRQQNMVSQQNALLQALAALANF